MSNYAVSVLSAGASEGLVIGIEGSWGSGKSSILNLLCSNIEKGAQNATVIRFDPWVVGDRDNMIAALMAKLASVVTSLPHPEGNILSSKANTAFLLSNKLRKYGANVGRGFSPLLKFASICGVPYGEFASKGLDAAIDAIDVHEKIKSLEELKEELVANLRDFKHRFIVVIDDIDRLEPAEAAEIARLVRAVGDFPNIVYLMCYDRDVLANSLQNAIQVNDGKAFLEKIIQISFPVPRPEEFDLRRWLLEECGNLHAAVSEKAQNQDVSERRLAAVCDAQGQQLQTPRDVVHVINALRLIYPSIANEVDFADLCWLQIIRLKNNDLYKWIEEYLTVLAAVTIDGAAINEVDRTDIAKRLNTLMPDSDISLSPRSIWYLGRHIPSVTQNTNGTCNVFENVSPETVIAHVLLEGAM